MSIKVSWMSPYIWHSCIHVSSMPHVYPAPPQNGVLQPYIKYYEEDWTLYCHSYNQSISNWYEGETNQKTYKQFKSEEYLVNNHIDYRPLICILQSPLWLFKVFEVPVPCFLSWRLISIYKAIIKGKHDLINHRHCVIKVGVKQWRVVLLKPLKVGLSIPVFIKGKNYHMCSDVMSFHKCLLL